MDYNFESLGPERFQIFCQSLLNSEFPKIQSFPIGQPDGGRDALGFSSNLYKDGFVVYQIKFVRKDEKNITAWLEEILKKESLKIKKLINKGAKEYILITNLSGTSHFNTGSIDKVQSLMTKYITIPSFCWWRDDLNVKLNDKWNLKWAFPELLNSTDLLRIIIESRLNIEDRERRFNAITAYLKDQYETDSKVKFKQVEIQNSLLDLFIDVPIRIKSGEQGFIRRSFVFQHLLRDNPDIKNLQVNGYIKIKENDIHYREENFYLGASTFFLNNYFEKEINSMVLEGGPGQGKSTITQYICQVHRIKLLNKINELQKIPDHHKNTALRLPFKIDLRDFALWIKNKNPFSPNQNEEIPNLINQSLEAFIAAHIKYFSGGIDFNVNDLHEIIKVSKILIVLDGFDEVADISIREDIVEIISKGIRRIKNNTIDIQIIVTSRPAAFINSPGFSHEEFQHFYLDSVNKPLIDNYADKWISSKQLSKKEGGELKRILYEKLEQPHIKDLAKNPMQLAILISLIHTKGYSLPDKRTAFYDSYIDVFFNRESEKDETIRNYRELIIELHQYIAWIIHRDAELGSNGRVPQKALVELVENFLETEGHDATFASKLFNKMAERVVALVSRLEGTFEFEVQPLREYFCAKYLYSTSNYSPAGKEQNGTLPDRFDAMAKNFYWLNVLRFYCGCYSKGELPSIIDRLEDLNQNDNYKYISQPRELSAILLSDWVFAQYPRLMQRVVRILLDGLGVRTLLTSDSGYNYRSQEMSLPLNSGREEIVEECFEILKTYPPQDYAIELISLILSNDNGQIIEKWKSIISNKKGIELIKWLEYGLYLRLIYKMKDTDLLSFFEDKEFIKEKVNYIIHGGKGEFIESMPEISSAIIEKIINGELIDIHSTRKENFLSSFIKILQPNIYLKILNNNSNDSCLRLFENFGLPIESMFFNFKISNTTFIKSPGSKKYVDYFKYVITELNKSFLVWNTSNEPWDKIIEYGRKQFGERISFIVIANIGAGIKSVTIKSENFDSLFDKEKSLVNRLRYARLRSTNAKWWRQQSILIKSIEDSFLYLLVLLTWSSTTVIRSLLSEIEKCISDLSDDLFQILYLQLKIVCKLNRQNSNYKYYFNDEKNRPKLNVKMILLLSTKLEGKNINTFKIDYLNNYKDQDDRIFELLQEMALTNFVEAKNIVNNLEIIKRSYMKGILNERNTFEYYNFNRLEIEVIDIKIAKKILSEPSNYPRILVKLAESSLKRNISKSIISLKEISENDNWFVLC